MNSSTDTGQPGTSDHLLRILGMGFGLAIVIGGTVGVGILRSPGPIAEQLGSVWLVMVAWALLGASPKDPQTGGILYDRRWIYRRVIAPGEN